MERSLEFVENRDPYGCFEADAEALSYVAQEEVRSALKRAELYTEPGHLSVVGAEVLNTAVRAYSLPLTFEEVLPHFNGFSGDEVALDDSPEVAKDRLQTLQTSLRDDDHRGLIIFYPCQRSQNPEPIGHFVAAIEGQTAEAALTVMDPSELRDDNGERIGGVFQRSEEETLDMLTPNPDLMIPVFAYSVRTDSLRQIMYEAGAAASVEIEQAQEEAQSQVLALV